MEDTQSEQFSGFEDKEKVLLTKEHGEWSLEAKKDKETSSSSEPPESPADTLTLIPWRLMLDF